MAGFGDQVSIMTQINPEVEKVPVFALHGGTVINLFMRITTGEKEVSKIRADVFFRLKKGEFITYADGKDKKVQFSLPKIVRELPGDAISTKEELHENFEQIYRDVRLIFGELY
jgi:hypothetical protein